MKRLKAGLVFAFSKLMLRFPSHGVRKAFLRIMGAGIGVDVALYSGAEVRSPDNLVIGDGTSIGHDAILDARRGLEIGRNVNLSSQVMIWTLQHDHRCPEFSCVGARTHIGDYAWLGPRTIVLPGIVVGEGAVVAAGAVVTKDVEPYTLVAGIPARKIGERRRDLTYRPGWKPMFF